MLSFIFLEQYFRSYGPTVQFSCTPDPAVRTAGLRVHQTFLTDDSESIPCRRNKSEDVFSTRMSRLNSSNKNQAFWSFAKFAPLF